jgi:hypothetical protein
MRSRCGTSLARTLLDLAAVLALTQLNRALEAAQRLELFDLRSIGDVPGRSNGYRGAGLLRRALTDHHDADLRSDLEARFLDLCREAGLPTPATNVLVGGFLVDAVWKEQRLVRFTHPMLERERERVVSILRSLLAP